MKKLIKTLSIIFISMLYGFVGSQYYSIILSSNSNIQDHRASQQDAFIASKNLNIFSFVNLNEKFKRHNNNIQVFTFKKYLNILDLLYKAEEKQITESFREKLNHFNFILVPLTRCDIIFPFHYFW